MNTLHDTENNRFILQDDNAAVLGLLEYKAYGHFLEASHTEVLPAHAGKGYAACLLDALCVYARKEHLKIIPVCSYVAHAFKTKSEQYQDVAAVQPF